MRILHVIPGLAARTGGGASALVELCAGLEAAGAETTILTTDLAETAAARRHAVATAADLPRGADALDVRLLRARTPHRLAYCPSLRATLRAELPRADVVHIHGLWLYPTWAAYREATAADVPYIVCPQGMLDPSLTSGRLRKRATAIAWQRTMFAHAAAVHFTAAEEQRIAGAAAGSAPSVVVPNPIDWSAYQDQSDPFAFRDRYLGGHRGPLVLNLGRIAHKKGLDILIRAFATVRRELPDARLAIVGPDDEGLTPELQSLAEREGVADRTTFVGMLTGSAKSDALAAADVWALPTRQDAWASAITEALASGLPVVVSEHANSAPDIRDAGAGIVLPLEADVFAASLLEVLSDERLRSELGKRARAFAHRFDRAEVGRAAIDMYDRAIAEAPVERNFVELLHA